MRSIAQSSPKIIEQINRKVLHLNRRAEVRSRGRIAGVSSVLSEVVQGRYMQIFGLAAKYVRDLVACFAKLFIRE